MIWRTARLLIRALPRVLSLVWFLLYLFWDLACRARSLVAGPLGPEFNEGSFVHC